MSYNDESLIKYLAAVMNRFDNYSQVIVSVSGLMHAGIHHPGSLVNKGFKSAIETIPTAWVCFPPKCRDQENREEEIHQVTKENVFNLTNPEGEGLQTDEEPLDDDMGDQGEVDDEGAALAGTDGSCPPQKGWISSFMKTLNSQLSVKGRVQQDLENPQSSCSHLRRPPCGNPSRRK